MSRSSKKFTPSEWTERLVPALLILLLVGLVATLVIVGLSVAGLIPAW